MLRLTLLALTAFAATVTYTGAHKCDHLPRGLYSIPNQPHQYLECANTGRWIRNCAAGSRFNANAGECKHSTGRYASLNTWQTRHILNELDVDIRDAFALAVAAFNEEIELSAAQNVTVCEALATMQDFLGTTTELKSLSIRALEMLQVLRTLVHHFDIEKDVVFDLMDKLPACLPEDECPYPEFPNITCNAADYQSNDGTCNNLVNKGWGSAPRPYVRYLQPDYADGFDAPRVAANGGPLPSAREVSISLYPDNAADTRSPVLNFMMVTFGQVVDHDIDRTAVTSLATSLYGPPGKLSCGKDGCKTQGKGTSACFPIPVPAGDPDFDKACLPFIRSEATLAVGCPYGPREQLNQITAYLDASFVYGSNDALAAALRDTNTSRGRLEMGPPIVPGGQDTLPRQDNEPCKELTDTVRCFKAGDARRNEFIGLTSLHTIFAREHNRIEGVLHGLNPHWGGEKLFQESRRILISEYQHIVMHEFVPLLLRPANLPASVASYTGYDDTVSVEIMNEFATAAFRYGHSQIPNLMHFVSPHLNETTSGLLSQFLFRPAALYDNSLPGGSGIDSILLGMIRHEADGSDNQFAEQLTKSMFTTSPPHGMGTDLPSLNTQRGRDHGLPGCIVYYEMATGVAINNFNDLNGIFSATVIAALQDLYDDVRDIDVFLCALLETPQAGGLLGEIFGDIVQEQFIRLRNGDRFWYENVFSADAAKLGAIDSASLSRIICDNGDNIYKLPPYAQLMTQAEANAAATPANQQYVNDVYAFYDTNNAIAQCHTLPSVDLSAWTETP